MEQRFVRLLGKNSFTDGFSVTYPCFEDDGVFEFSPNIYSPLICGLNADIEEDEEAYDDVFNPVFISNHSSEEAEAGGCYSSFEDEEEERYSSGQVSF